MQVRGQVAQPAVQRPQHLLALRGLVALVLQLGQLRTWRRMGRDYCGWGIYNTVR